MMLNEQLKNEIRQIYDENKGVSNSWIFDDVPPKRLKNGIKRFGENIRSDETIILFNDATAFGSGKEGLILTDQAIYLKSTSEPARRLSIEYVHGFRGTGGRIWIQTTNIGEEFDLITVDGQHLSVLLANIIALFRNDVKEESQEPVTQATSTENWRCVGCKAVNVAVNTHCEWCRKPKFIEPSERPQPQANQTNQQVDVNGILNNVNNMLGNMNLSNGTFTSTSSMTTINGQTVNSSEMTAEQKQQFDEAFKDFGNFFNN